MKAVAGVFTSKGDAQSAAHELMVSAGLSKNKITLLFPGGGRHQEGSVPLSATEQPGMGKVVAGAVGGAVGVAGGLELGAAIAAIIPGVGPVVATGLLGAGLLGFVGADVGAAVGGALENAFTDGLPEDEIFVYEDAVRQGRTVLIALAEDDHRAEFIRGLMRRQGAETVDAAREKWWIGLRDAEREHYTARPGCDFDSDEVFYRLGFEAALHARTRGKEYDQVLSEMSERIEELKARYPGCVVEEPFERGYERGRAYYEALRRKTQPKR
jgi:hypothetical protein